MASPESTELTLGPPEGGRPLRLTWERGAAESIARGDLGPRTRSPWQVHDAVDWEHAEELRLVSAVFDDERALAVAAIRPRGATGHDEDSVAHHLVEAGQEVELSHTLLSIEYDSAGLPRRLGIELWDDPEAPPLRVAADRQGDVEVDGDVMPRQLARMAFRLNGTSGAGSYEVLRPA